MNKKNQPQSNITFRTKRRHNFFMILCIIHCTLTWVAYVSCIVVVVLYDVEEKKKRFSTDHINHLCDWTKWARNRVLKMWTFYIYFSFCREISLVCYICILYFRVSRVAIHLIHFFFFTHNFIIILIRISWNSPYSVLLKSVI